MGLGQYTWWNNPYPAADDFDDQGFFCTACDDAGCLECCPPEPITLDDLITIDAEIAAFDFLSEPVTIQADIAESR